MSDISPSKLVSPVLNPGAGTPLPIDERIDVQALVQAYYDHQPDPENPLQRVVFGTSGHRGSALDASFNQWHVWAIVQAICDYRRHAQISGPLHLGFDTHALSEPAFESALEVLAANDVDVRIAVDGEYTPTPVISRAILTYNRGRTSALSDGIVITPSHNPPDAGGLKYNTPNGGPADTKVTRWIQTHANGLLNQRLRGVRTIPFSAALHASSTHPINLLESYIAELAGVIDMAAIARSGLCIGVDSMGGAGINYWARIAERYGLNLTLINQQVDPQFGFMTRDWDGKIRMDPSSRFAMQPLIARKDQFDIAIACDTDHDRHGVVTPEHGLLSANHYLSAALDYLAQHRPFWRTDASVGKTVVSTAMLDKIAKRQRLKLMETPVGFKYFAEGLLGGSLLFACEESAGASFSQIDGNVWTTDKDGISAALLAAEITAVTGKNPAQRYAELEHEFGVIYGDRIEAVATPLQKQKLTQLDAKQVTRTALAGDAILNVMTHAPGGAAIGGIKIVSAQGWFAARPSGTEDIYKIYAESFNSAEHLNLILTDAKALVALALESEND